MILISYIELAGYKSLSRPQRVPVAGLTLLAGANSSGKSSLMQSLLLLKQTLECQYDPGAILLDGPNAKITASDQIISRVRSEGLPSGTFSIGVGTKVADHILRYRRASTGSLRVESVAVRKKGQREWLELREGQNVNSEKVRILSEGKDPLIPKELLDVFLKEDSFEFSAVRDRCFLKLSLTQKSEDGNRHIGLEFPVSGDLQNILKGILHIPGLRGNPERTYSATEVGNLFPGTYEHYIASIIWKWQSSSDERLASLGDQLRLLGLTWKVAARKIQDTRVELKVGRLPRAAKGGAKDLVSLADVGLGVAQVLPILVALLSASRGQIVYIEQPELHLHPRAQWRMAEIIRDAVNRGVRIIVETHSSVLLRGVQTQIAIKKMKPAEASFCWFTRDLGDGSTLINSVVPDGNGAFGDWPADFDDIGLEVEGAYLDAVSGD